MARVSALLRDFCAGFVMTGRTRVCNCSYACESRGAVVWLDKVLQVKSRTRCKVRAEMQPVVWSAM